MRYPKVSEVNEARNEPGPHRASSTIVQISIPVTNPTRPTRAIRAPPNPVTAKRRKAAPALNRGTCLVSPFHPYETKKGKFLAKKHRPRNEETNARFFVTNRRYKETGVGFFKSPTRYKETSGRNKGTNVRSLISSIRYKETLTHSFITHTRYKGTSSRYKAASTGNQRTSARS